MNKDDILYRTNAGLDVFKHYVSIPFKIGQNFKNPLYDDKRASCNVYFDKRSGMYRLKDFGNDDYSGDCFFFVGKLLNLDCNRADDFKEILRHIAKDLHLSSSHTHRLPQRKVEPPIKQKPASEFKYVEQDFTVQQLAWWKQYGVEVDLLKNYGVVSLAQFECSNREGKPFCIRANESDPLYAYRNGKHIKIYRPFSRYRFMQAGTMPNVYCFGWKQLPKKGDLLFITGGEKDVLSLASQGLFAIAFNSETSQIPKETIRNLSFRFKHIVLLFDVDQTGIDSACKQTSQLAEFGVINLQLPLSGTKQEKDVSDYFKLGNTARDLMLLFTHKLDAMYRQNLMTLRLCEVDMRNPPLASNAIISANGVPLGTQGNMFCITGAEGTGKSNYTSALLAGAICDEGCSVDCLGVTVEQNMHKKAVLLYDTEQSEMQLFRNTKRLLERAERAEMPDFFHAFCMASIGRKERLGCIEQSMDRYYYKHGGIQLVVIDGIADLISSTNDEGESIALVEKLHRLAGLYNTCIVTVLHFIPSGIKLRGHLGSELQRKVASILAIEQEKDKVHSVVKAIKVREGSPLDVPMMLFAWDDKLHRHSFRGLKPEQTAKARKKEALLEASRLIFSQHQSLSYTELATALQNHFDVKERTAKEYIKFMFDQKMVEYASAEKRAIRLTLQN